MKSNRVINWIESPSHIIGKTHDKSLKDKKIAAFDLDHTLIKPSDNKKFSDTDTDWITNDKTIKNKLKGLVDNGYLLVIISNQKGISNGKVSVETFKKKLSNVVNFFDQDFVILCSLEDDLFRKPRTGLWDKFVKGDIKTSFYCGDAAGNPNDFSDTDLKFALNLGLEFRYVTEFITDKKVKCIPNYPIDFKTINNGTNYVFTELDCQEVIINVGLPGSGKSTFTENYIVPKNYIYVNQDTLKTKAKCIKLVESSIKNGKSVVIDNVNINKEQRKVFIDIAKKYNLKIRCLHFTTSKDLCVHNAYFRNYITNGDRKIIPNIVFNILNKKFEEPEISEGFYKIEKIDFCLNLDKNIMEKYTKFMY